MARIFIIDNYWVRLCASILIMLNMYADLSREATEFKPFARGFHRFISLWSISMLLRTMYDIFRMVRDRRDEFMRITQAIRSASRSIATIWKLFRDLGVNFVNINQPGTYVVSVVAYCIWMLYTNIVDFNILRATGHHHTWPPYWAWSLYEAIRVTVWIFGTVIGALSNYLYWFVFRIFFPTGREALTTSDDMRTDIRVLRRLRFLRVWRKD